MAVRWGVDKRQELYENLALHCMKMTLIFTFEKGQDDIMNMLFCCRDVCLCFGSYPTCKFQPPVLLTLSTVMQCCSVVICYLFYSCSFE